MEKTVERVLARAVVCLAAGILCGRQAQLAYGLLLAAAAMVGAVGWLLDRERIRGYGYIAAFLLGMAVIGYADLPEKTAEAFIGQEIMIEGQVVDSPQGKYYLTVQVTSVNNHRLAHGGQALVVKPYGEERVFERGSQIAAQGLAQGFLGATNPGGFDSRAYWRSQGVYWQLKSVETPQVTRPPAGVWQLSNGAAQALKERLARYLPEAQYQLMQALLLGEKGELAPDFYSLSQKLGLAHVFAVSGLHVGFVAAFVLMLLRALRLERSYLAAAVLFLVLGVYCLMIGLPPSAVRASIMAVLGLAAVKWLRYKDMYTILAAAALIILLAQPQALWSVGFQLSFVATWGLLYLYPPIRRALHWLPGKGLREGLAVALAAQAASAPLVAWHFYQFSALAPLMNLLVVPLVGLLVPLLLAALAVAFALPFLGKLVFWPCSLLAGVLDELLNGLAAILGTGHLFVGQPPVWGILLYYGLLCLWREGWLSKWRPRLSLAVGAAALAGVIVLSLPGRPAWDQAVFLDVGQGTSTVVRTTDGRALVFDGGASAGDTASYLKYCGVNYLDALVLSHGDLDHTTGFHQLLRDFRVRRFILPANSLSVPEVQALVELAQRQRTDIIVVKEQASLRFGQGLSLTATMYGPPGGAGNERELLTQLTLGGRLLVLPGDLEQEGLAQWLDDSGRADVWAVPHHGSKSACFDQLYERLSPQAAVISAGRNNRYGHPHQEVLTSLMDAGIPYFRTDQSGAVTVSFTPAGLRIDTYLR